jgi:hypothetical protein
LFDRSDRRRDSTAKRILVEAKRIKQHVAAGRSGHERGFRATAGNNPRRARDEPFRPRFVGRRLPYEANRDEARSNASQLADQLFGHHQESACQYNCQCAPPLVAGLQLRTACRQQRRLGVGIARTGRESDDRG